MAAFPPQYDAGNIFKKIINGDIPCHKIFETEHTLAILDAFPAAPGHSLLLPKGEFATIADMPPEVAGEFFKELPRLTRAVVKATGADGCNVVTNLGRAAGQEVLHAHVHVLPRKENDQLVAMPKSAPQMISKEDGTSMREKIASEL
eukprot:GGOE01054669.1.p1 GENE.GGOE01054669.1~~GGOE01054669.1.p1  ORF type:complete len:156 (+),score=51.86 GGOE01054669.1:30-470(+)